MRRTNGDQDTAKLSSPYMARPTMPPPHCPSPSPWRPNSKCTPGPGCPVLQREITPSNGISELQISHLSLSRAVENDWKKRLSLMLSLLHGRVTGRRISKQGIQIYHATVMNLTKANAQGEHRTCCIYNILYNLMINLSISSIQPRPSLPASSRTRGMAVYTSLLECTKLTPSISRVVMDVYNIHSPCITAKRFEGTSCTGFIWHKYGQSLNPRTPNCAAMSLSRSSLLTSPSS